jgi:predicted O-linked N-acetylglucosamine transferase (SPINDLY family)
MAWSHFGTVLCQQGRLSEGVGAFRECLRIAPGLAGAQADLARALETLGLWRESAQCYGRALSLAPSWQLAVAHANMLLKAGERTAALEAFEAALISWPGEVQLHNARGVMLGALGQHSAARSCFARALSLRSDAPETHYNHGRACLALGEPESALESLQRALAARPDWYDCQRALGNALQACGRSGDAIESYRRALALRSDDPGLLEELATSLSATGDLAAAVTALDQAVALRAPDPHAYASLGDLHRATGSFDAALEAYGRGIVAAEGAFTEKAALSQLLYRRGALLAGLGRLAPAAADAERLLLTDPDHPYAAGLGIYLALAECRWDGLEERIARALASVRLDLPAVPPWLVIATSDSPEDQLQSARTWVRTVCSPSAEPLWKGESYGHERLRVAYLCSELDEHPVARSLAALVEHHDRRALEIIGVAVAPRTVPTPSRLQSGFDRFIDASRLADRAIAAALREAEVDIAVDLTGYTAGGRPNVLAARAAPVQVSFLGYPGTMGAPFIDYLVSDTIAVPPESARFFTERIAYLPHCALPAAGRPADAVAARSDHGLPSRGVVFGAFHTLHKLTPRMFASWMRILSSTGDSVLWLGAGASEAARARLRVRAEHFDVDPTRLIFAEPITDRHGHFARLGCADLFLDTLPYNAHSSACDALCAGVPVLTCAGRALAARVGASLLGSVGLAELATDSLAAYERLAIALARDAARRDDLRQRLRTAIAAAAPFDPLRFCASLEQAFRKMALESCQGGRPPHDVALSLTPA